MERPGADFEMRSKGIFLPGQQSGGERTGEKFLVEVKKLINEAYIKEHFR